MRRRWRRLGLLAGFLGAAWATGRRRRRRCGPGSISSGLGPRSPAAELEPARRRLAALASARPGALGGAVEYWLGVCEASLDHPDAALRAFARVPDGFPFDTHGRLPRGAGEPRAGPAPAPPSGGSNGRWPGRPGPGPSRALLRHVYEIEVRFDDAKALVLRAASRDAADPIRVLRELSNFELERVPADGLRAALEKAGRLAPEEDRVELGLGRLAIWPAAGTRRRAGSALPRPPSPTRRSGGRGWSGPAGPAAPKRPSERRSSSATISTLGEQLELRAWLEEQRGDARAEVRALEAWLRVGADGDRGAGAPRRAGPPRRQARSRDRVEALPGRGRSGAGAIPAAASGATRHPAWRPNGSQLARLAEAAGRRAEARALYAWALAADPGHAPAREALARLDRAEADQRRELPDRGSGPGPPLCRAFSGYEAGCGGPARPGRLQDRRCQDRRPELRLRHRRDA